MDLMARPMKPSPNALAGWVRRVRLDAGLTQADFGARIKPEEPHIHPTTVTRWERGQMKLELDSIALIRRAFPGALPPPIDGMSDPDRSLLEEHNGSRQVELTEGAIVARDIDREPDEAKRIRLRNAALQAIQEEKRKIAGEPQQNPTELGADKEARPRSGKPSSGRGR